MTASTIIYVDEKTDAVILPGKATRFTPDPGLIKPPVLPVRTPAQASGTKTVWVRDEKTRLRPVQITTGIDNGTSVEVVSGLNEGDEVITAMSRGSEKAAATKNSDGPRGPFPF
jgi:HlyD family secretion protein